MEQYQRKTMNLYNIICQSQPGNYYEYNLKSDKETLLNRINSSIMIEFHAHPLFSCFTPQRANCSQYWTCFQCKCNYSYKVPSFYCTACNYDLCQKCLMQCKLFTIQMYDYSKNEYKNIDMNPNQLNTYAHNHCMTLIQPENYNTDGNYVIHCKSCRCDIKSKEYFYYCSLCNFYICQNCFGQRSNNNNPYNQPQNFPNQFPGTNLGNNPQIYNRVNNNQFNNINNNNNIQNNGSQEYNNNQGNNINNNYANSNIKNINGQNTGFSQINNNSNNNNNNFSNINNINNIKNNNTAGQNFNNINNNFPSSELPNQSQNNTNTSEIINPLVMNSKNTDNKQINNDKPSDNNNNIRQSEIEQVEDYLSGNQIQFNQNHQNAK